jgi:hypothetical protein
VRYLITVLGDRVQKEELLHLHMLLIHVRKYYETINNEEISTERYNTLHISPVHIHKNKQSHKEAILVLGQELVDHLNRKTVPTLGYSSDMVASEITAEH